MSDVLPFAIVQFLLTLFLVVLLWCLQARLRRQEFFRLWAWAWTAFAVSIACRTAEPSSADDWTAARTAAALVGTVAGLLQFPLLAYGAASLRARSPWSRRRLRAGLAVALAAGLLAFAVSALARADPALSGALREVPRALALAVAWCFCGIVVLTRWRDERGAAGVLGASCLLYAADHAAVALALVDSAEIYGAPGWLRDMLSQPGPLLADLVCMLGIGLGMVLMLLDRHEEAERALRDKDVLRESEERYRALVSASAQVVWRTEASGDAVFVTSSWQQLTGQTDEQMRGFGWMQAVHPDDRPRVLQAWREAAAGGRAYENEMRVRTRDGSYRLFHTRGVPVLAEDGSVREWVGANTDITERRAAEEALREGQRRYRLATEAGRTGVWDLDLDSGAMYVDPFLKAMLGFEDGQTPDTLDTWTARVFPDDVEAVKSALAAHVSGATRQYEMEHRMVHRDGSVRWFLARGRLVVDADGRRRVVGTDTDVTARRAAEEALQEVQARHRAILRAIPDLMFLQDRQGVYLDAHAREAGSFLVPPEWFLGKNMRDVLPPELARSFAAAFETAMRSGESTLEYELPVRGETLHWEARMVRCDRDKVLSIVRDITARKRAEQEARGLRDELAHVGRVSLLSTLTGSIAHEINQPLAAIMANASAALRLTAAHEPDLPELRETLGDIVDDGRRAGQVLRRLRALLTKEASEHGLVELKGTLDEVLRLVDSDVVGRRVSLEVDVPADLPAVRGDRVQLQQVVLNLLLNAFEAVRDLDVPARRVRLSASATDDGRAVLSVSDEGVGVPDDELPRIFEPFYTTKRGGMGLGLPICQTIATAHGGVLQATRNRGPGMTFSLLLPAVAGEAPHAEASVALPS